MIDVSVFESHLSSALLRIFRRLSTPMEIQAYLDELPYVAEELNRSPLRVMQDKQAHCLDGGIFASLCLARNGFRPVIMDILPEPGADDDHVLALYQYHGSWGCIAKSNYAFLRFREPVYRNLRELTMSYFESFTNTKKEKTLRAYTRPLDLSRFDADWMWCEQGIARIEKRLYQRKPIPLIPSETATLLSLSDDRFYRANTLGTNFDWAFGIRENR